MVCSINKWRVNLLESVIYEASASSDEIQVILDLIEPHLIGFPREHGFMACISMAIILMKPNATEEELQSGLQGTSKYICSLLAGDQMPMDMKAKVLMN